MRLALVTEIIAPYRIPVLNALARQAEIDLHVIFLAETDPTQRRWQVYKQDIQFSYGVLPSWRWRFLRHHVLLNWGMAGALRRAAPDAIVCGGYNYPASWIVWRWAHQHRVPLILWVESTAQDRRGGRALVEAFKRRFVRGCDAFIVPGQSSREYLRHFGLADEQIVSAPNAVDNDLFASHAQLARQDAARHRNVLGVPPRFFLFAGRLVAEKGIFDLLEAYGKLAPGLKQDWGLVFVGDGRCVDELKRRASALPRGRVVVAGFAQREQLAAYYGLADAFVFPTHSDPWGLVVNEAMACGLPVITTRIAGSTADLVTDGWNGFVVEAGDPDQLASAMTRIAVSPELRAKMAWHSRDRIAAYSPEACAAGIARAAVSARYRT